MVGAFFKDIADGGLLSGDSAVHFNYGCKEL